jgi:hypothetical protein
MDSTMAAMKLEAYVKGGQGKSAGVVKHLQDEAANRVDVLLPMRPDITRFLVRPDNLALTVHTPMAIEKLGRELGFTQWSLGQALGTLRVPTKFLEGLQADGREDIATYLLNELLYRAGDKRLLRTVEGQIRGWLSPTYGIIDQGELIAGFIAAIKAHADKGVAFTDGHITDRRYTLTAMWPHVLEPWPGEFVVVGATMQSSDYGFGAVDVKQHLTRLVCLNGALGIPFFRKIHRGSGYGDDDADDDLFEVSERTRQLTAATTLSLITDALTSAFKEATVEKTLYAYRTAAHREIDVEKEARTQKLAGLLGKKDVERINAVIDMDIIDVLPQTENKRSALRFGQLLSYMANEAEGDRALQMQEVAGTYYLPQN